jgi:hypothetical protein
VAGRLIVEQLDGETLVYDTERHEAHTLSGSGAAEFLAVEDEVSRRDVLRKLALAGAAAAGAGALVKTIVAPKAAQAQSPNCGVLTCTAGQTCCSGSIGVNQCCATGTTCCQFAGQLGITVVDCCTAAETCGVGGCFS